MPTDKDALSLLKGDHDDVKKLFKEIEAEEDQGAIFNQIKEALEAHATIEEEIFYPAVKKARSEEVKDEVREAYEEHKQVKALLAAITEISPEDESYSAKIKV
jgi:hemerythrin superfamily protein